METLLYFKAPERSDIESAINEIQGRKLGVLELTGSRTDHPIFKELDAAHQALAWAIGKCVASPLQTLPAYITTPTPTISATS